MRITRLTSDTICFVVNFLIATLIFICAAVSIAMAANPYAFFGGIVIVLPVLCYAIAEWLCWYRDQHWLLRPLGILNLLLAALCAFGIITNIGEAIMADDPVSPLFILLLVSGFTLVTGYLGWCGWRRFHLAQTALMGHTPSQPNGTRSDEHWTI
jgi:hypothetical protein